jgi:arylamine N-acetyltransferase
MFHKLETPFFVLNRYVSSLDASIEIDPARLAENLQNLAIKHFQKYPFHSLYFNLKDQRSLETKSIPLVLERNALIHQLIEDCGGSCYHHNAVFQAILEKSGIESWFVACLVHNPMKPEETFESATHIAIIFRYQGTLYLFDPGWDGTSFSMYPLPSSVGTAIRHDSYQVRMIEGEAEFPFVFAEVKPDGAVIPRYDFNIRATRLEDYSDAVQYLNSQQYAFHTLFLFSQITADQKIIRLINRRLIIQNLSGDERFNEELSDDVSPLQKITELLGEAETGLMASLQVEDFKNPQLGQLICQSLTTSLKAVI